MRDGSSRLLIAAAACAAATFVVGTGSASAAPTFAPFLSVDFNNATASSPTQAGFTGLGVAQSTTNVSPVSGSSGGYGYTLSLNPSAANANGASLSSRDRGAQGSSPSFSDLYRDFALVTRDTTHALGYNYLQITITGLSANTAYEFTGFSEDPFSASGSVAAGGVGNREGYSPAVPAEYSPGSAPASGGPYYYTPYFSAPAGEYDNSVSFDATSDASGNLTIYAFGDSSTYNGQTATIVNGFQLGLVATPEPTTLGVIGIGAVGMLARRRKS